MDVNNRQLERLLHKTDDAFKQLLADPASEQLSREYDTAKEELDDYLSSLRHSLQQKYKDF